MVWLLSHSTPIASEPNNTFGIRNSYCHTCILLSMLAVANLMLLKLKLVVHMNRRSNRNRVDLLLNRAS